MLRLSSHEFWTMTPRELAFAMQPFQHKTAAPERAQLDALLVQFPDEKELA